MNEKDITTSNKIKKAAGKLFSEKGFGRTTTRDISTEAGVNLALVNYHFRSKEELFHTIMAETVLGFIGQMSVLLNDNHSFDQKLELVVENYINLLHQRPDLPIFMLSEMRSDSSEMAKNLGLSKMFHEAQFFKDLEKRCPEGISPVQLMINILSLTIFPFVAKPLVQSAFSTDESSFYNAMEVRKKFIPLWIKSMLKPES